MNDPPMKANHNDPASYSEGVLAGCFGGSGLTKAS